MKQQTFVNSQISAINGSVIAQSNTIETRQRPVKITGIIYTARATVDGAGTPAAFVSSVIEVRTENTNLHRIFGTALFASGAIEPIKNNFSIPVNVFVPCEIELKSPVQLNITLITNFGVLPPVGDAYQITYNVTLYYEEIEDIKPVFYSRANRR